MQKDFITYEFYMQRCLELAASGSGDVAPNPLVGCVIVHGSKIIGEGYHKKFGDAHAEVNAINSVKDKSLLSKSVLYVSLEPCSHFGKTPPCTDLIIKNKIPEVIIGIKDPFEKMNGSGIKKLEAAGIKVTSGVLEEECRYMNRRFIIFHENKRPYIILKWAQSTDGFIALLNNSASGKIHWISNEYSRMLVHKWRSEEAAIMIGTNTALQDNPMLTARNWSGKNPVRIVIDKDLRLPHSLHLFDQKTKTIVFTSKEKESLNNLEYYKIDFQQEIIHEILKILFEQNIQSVIIEGGTQLLSSFIQQELWDEARVFTGSHTMKTGIKAPAISGNIISYENIDTDTLTVFMK